VKKQGNNMKKFKKLLIAGIFGLLLVSAGLFFAVNGASSVSTNWSYYASKITV